jgi:hypothetical protein
MDQALIREDVVRLQTQTAELIARFDRGLGFMKALLITLLGVAATILGATSGAFWNASRIDHAVEDHGRRIEKIENADEGRAKLQQSIDRIQQTLDARLPAAEK